MIMPSKSELASLRNISAKRVGARIHVVGLTPEPLVLHMLEAHELFGGLLKAIPGIPNAVDLAWSWRNVPTAKVRLFYGLDSEYNIVHTGAIGEAYLHGVVFVRTRMFPTKEEAYTYLVTEFGELLELTEVYDSPGSYQSAEKKRVMAIATEYAKAQGITLEELWKRAKSSERSQNNSIT